MTKPAPPKRYTGFQEFYPCYLSEYQHATSRVLHFNGTGLLILVALAALVLGKFLWLLVPVIGYGFAWVGHFIFGRNKPATFQHSFYGLASDFKLFFDILRGRQKFKSKLK